MEDKIRAVLKDYEDRWRDEFENVLPQLSRDDVVRRRDSMLMSIGPETGMFLNLIVKGGGYKTVLELGTSYGHSTVYLAEAARYNGSVVISCDTSCEKQSYAESMLRQAGLADHVIFRTGDAVEIAASLDQPVDFALIDLWTAAYVPAFEALYPHLRNGSLVVADNMLIPSPTEAAAYRAYVRTKADLESVLIPVGWGLEVSRYIADRHLELTSFRPDTRHGPAGP